MSNPRGWWRTLSRARGIARADLLVSIAVCGLLGLLVVGLPGAVPTDTTPTGLQRLRSVSQAVGCRNNLREMGRGVAHLRGDFNQFNPALGDEGYGPLDLVYTWADLLYELGYVADDAVQYCPADEAPDPIAALRGQAWGDYRFVREFGVGETPRFGIRSSYGINPLAHFDWREDEYPDQSRQIYAMDATWTFLGGINALWFNVNMYGFDGKPVSWDPLNFLGWSANMVAWRHADFDHASTALFYDGSARSIKPNLYPGLSRRTWSEIVRGTLTTVDRVQAFTWLPGEQLDLHIGMDWYEGQVASWRGWSPRAHGYNRNPQKPMALDPDWRSVRKGWNRLPADPADRH